MDEPDTNPIEPKLVELDSSGDIIFLVQEKVRLRVSSKVMSLASKPFAAMFSARFLEGQNLSADDPKSVSLPEDDANAMKTLCSLLHHQYIEQLLEENELLDLVIAADKYDCVKAIRGIAIHWLNLRSIESWKRFLADRKTEQELIPSFLQHILLAHYLGDFKLFQESCNFVITHCEVTTSIQRLMPSGQLLISSCFWADLEERRAHSRSRMMRSLLQLLVEQIEPYGTAILFCSLYQSFCAKDDSTNKLSSTHINLATMLLLWEGSQISTDHLATGLLHGTNEFLKDAAAYDPKNRKACFATKLQNLVKGWSDDIPTYCLNCIAKEQYPLGTIDNANNCSKGCEGV